MAGLALTRKKEDGFAVLMLHTGQRLTVHVRNIHLLLTGGMRVQPNTNLVCGGFDRDAVRPVPEQVGHARKVFRQQHAGLRKSQLEHGVIGDIVPVDQILDDVWIDAKGQDIGHHLHIKPLLVGYALELRNPVKVTLVIHLETRSRSFGRDRNGGAGCRTKAMSGFIQHRDISSEESPLANSHRFMPTQYRFVYCEPEERGQRSLLESGGRL